MFTVSMFNVWEPQQSATSKSTDCSGIVRENGQGKKQNFDKEYTTTVGQNEIRRWCEKLRVKKVEFLPFQGTVFNIRSLRYRDSIVSKEKLWWGK